MSEAVPIWMENKPRCIAVTTAALWENAAAAACCLLALKAEHVPSVHRHEPEALCRGETYGKNRRRSLVLAFKISE